MFNALFPYARPSPLALPAAGVLALPAVGGFALIAPEGFIAWGVLGSPPAIAMVFVATMCSGLSVPFLAAAVIAAIPGLEDDVRWRLERLWFDGAVLYGLLGAVGALSLLPLHWGHDRMMAFLGFAALMYGALAWLGEEHRSGMLSLFQVTSPTTPDPG